MPTESTQPAQSPTFLQTLQSQIRLQAAGRDQTTESAQLRPSRTNYMFARWHNDEAFSRRRVWSEKRKTSFAKQQPSTAFRSPRREVFHDRALEILVRRSDGSGGVRGGTDGHRDNDVLEPLHRARSHGPKSPNGSESSNGKRAGCYRFAGAAIRPDRCASGRCRAT